MTNPLAVVTGAASGIGLALTRELAARAVDVIAIDRNPVPVDFAGLITPLQIDICNAAAMQHLAETYRGRALHYLFANAGIAAPGSVLGATAAEWQRAWEVNTMGPLNTLRCWWPHLRLAGGRAVVTASAAALLSYPGAPLYRASKAALLSVMEGLYYESQGSGISLHVLCPGMVQSNIVAEAIREKGGTAADPLSRYLLEAMRTAEPAESFAKRVLDELDGSPPFYWLTHAGTIAAIEQRHQALVTIGRPPVEFKDMP
jgi:NAD(P)-dependent dehydrogenase (short-subunit alcohol dehydrogenase family)